jgi:hypothetical protein
MSWREISMQAVRPSVVAETFFGIALASFEMLVAAKQKRLPSREESDDGIPINHHQSSFFILDGQFFWIHSLYQYIRSSVSFKDFADLFWRLAVVPAITNCSPP